MLPPALAQLHNSSSSNSSGHSPWVRIEAATTRRTSGVGKKQQGEQVGKVSTLGESRRGTIVG